MGTVVSLDGVVVSPDDAKISVFDRGFLYGDSVYEVVRTYQSVPFELDAHLERLEGSATRIAMRMPFSRAQLAEETLHLHRSSGNLDSYVRIIVTRGGGRIGLDIALAETPRRIVIVQDLVASMPPPPAYEVGVEVALVGVRRNLRSAIDPAAKTGNYLNSVMALAEARARGAYEALMLDHRDLVTEGASSNVFLSAGGSLITPPLDAGILEGVTRKVVICVAKQAGIPVLELPLTESSLLEASEVLLTSSIREIVPVVRINGRVIGDGRPGPIYQRLRELFAAYVRDHVARHRPATRPSAP